MIRKTLALAVVLALATLSYVTLAAAATGTAPVPCHLPHLSERVACGTIAVPEDRADPASRRILVHYARIPASARPAAPDALLVLAGGPGQGALDYGPLVTSAFKEARKGRDVLLVDQRGTGRSAPLDCPLPVEAIARDDTPAVQASLRRCLARLQADPRHYHSSAALADFEDLRRALGYRQFSLWGGSYGTRTALLYARRHPASIRAMVLDAVAPPNVRALLTSNHSQAALARLLADCRGDAGCAAAFPDLAGDVRKVLALPALGPHTGAAVPQLLRGALYTSRHASVLPYAIHQAAAGRPAALLGLYDATAGWSLDGMAFGQTLSALCHEEAPFLEPAAMARDAAGSGFGDGHARSWRDWCTAWPAPQPDPALAEAVVSNVPALLLAGGLDPVTPVANARLAARTLRHSRVLVAEQGAHVFSAQGCTPHLIAAFLEHADPAAVDGACLAQIRRPPFVLAGGQPTL